MNLPPFNPFVPQFRGDPYPVYRRYREDDPMHWNGSPDHRGPGTWCVFRHDDVTAALKHPAIGKTRRPMAPEPLGSLLGQWMLLRNPPDHTRLRGLVTKAFTPAVVERLRGSIQQTADTLLDAVQPAGEMDAIADYASALPLIVIAEMLGIPPRDRAQFRKWSIDLGVMLDVAPTRQAMINATKSVLELTEYLRGIVAARRQEPQDDLITVLIAAEDAGATLSEDELLAMCVLLLGAGHETTVNLLGNGIVALLQHRDELERLRADPSLTENAVEELLRYDSPVQMAFREALDDVEIGGATIRKGEAVTVILGSANRDPAQFAEPDRLDLRRPRPRHLSFGHGIHFCIGAPLARVEAQIALDTLLRRLPAIRLNADALAWHGIVFKGVDALPVRF